MNFRSHWNNIEKSPLHPATTHPLIFISDRQNISPSRHSSLWPHMHKSEAVRSEASLAYITRTEFLFLYSRARAAEPAAQGCTAPESEKWVNVPVIELTPRCSTREDSLYPEELEFLREQGRGYIDMDVCFFFLSRFLSLQLSPSTVADFFLYYRESSVQWVIYCLGRLILLRCRIQFFAPHSWRIVIAGVLADWLFNHLHSDCY